MNILFCGGGTVGHITPAIAIAEEFKKQHKDINIAFVGRSLGNENEVIRSRGYKLYEIEISGLIRKLTLKNLKVIKNIFAAEKEAKKIIKDFGADAVIGTGGYVCFPVIRAASKLGIFTAIHESNSTLGLSSKLLSKKCDTMLLGAESLITRKNSIYTGNPISDAFYKTDKKTARRTLRISENQFFILSVGGSIGSEKLNEACLGMMKTFSLERRNTVHYHLSGKRYYEAIKEKYPELISKNRKCTVFPFTDKMPIYLSAADLVISRCGAMTLSEISASKSASILIPSPNVTGDHQTKNAIHFTEHGASIMINEKDLSKDVLITITEDLINNPDKLQKMSENAFRLSSPDSAKKIVNIIENQVRT